MKYYLSLLLVILLSTSSLYGQDYKMAAGVRAGFPSGANYKIFIAKERALEGILSAYGGGFEIAGFYELHKQAFDTPYLKFYYGPGLHIGYFSKNALIPAFYNEKRGRGFMLGIDAILGIEYRFTESPFVLAFDIQPALDLSPRAFLYIKSGLSLRFYF